MQVDLKNRVALVTGGSGAIGRIICVYLARAGARVVASCSHMDAPSAKALQKDAHDNGWNIALQPFDVASFKDTQQAVDAITADHGQIEILVNGAGITRDAPLKRMSEEQWDQVISVNLDSVFNTCRTIAPGMAESGYGRIINLSSINGQKGQFGQCNYSAAKAGMHGFTMALAQEVAAKGVTVNTISPGYIDSPMIQAVPEEIRDNIKKDIPAKRFGQPRDIAAAVTYLCSEQASFVTGVNLPVNGGHFIH
ncbi:acetoacetyl-CoA reductase [Algiphilus sp.]|uniref:acetoacetyl-CoA reductase n=1 Tax=Algiphilus sp. TaxID=1872431 RepID=UPI001CA726ED|nr:acetoacetyl-CoA reductase [Algiphilus sp.]MBY8966318.1 acetoacetyl-CoA reductase [Algiphilus acroporae]MCI5061762.1 acetoacetyl-CoA reductase [Algiphilus sp.]MCI5102221.1 acetoacetyl-CoA reductase [Algiphilus sp.]MCR9090907.1 acetoacetyl-CoA reductase [Pseudomonadota bacterium]